MTNNTFNTDSQTARLVLFDFDGTLTTKDTFIEFIKFVSGSLKFYTGFALLLPILVLYKLKVIKNWRAKEIVFSYFFKGMRAETFYEWGNKFAVQKLPALVRSKAIKAIREHQASGDVIYLVTASSSVWIGDWAKNFDMSVLDTQWAIQEGLITGRIEGKNCYGAEKANRIRQKIALDHFQTIIAYGDTRGDREMLDLAHQKYYRVFH